MDSFLYEHEKLFQLNPDRTVSPVINKKLIIGADNDEDKTLTLLNMEYEENDDKKNVHDEIFCELRSGYRHSKQKMLPNLLQMPLKQRK